jgi:preprotein translocase subunit SecA
VEGSKLGRNDPCHCGSGKKYKQCHLAKDEDAARAARAKAAETTEPAPAAAEAGTAAAPAPPKHAHSTQQPWKKGSTNTRGFQRMSAPRKVGSG